MSWWQTAKVGDEVVYDPGEESIGAGNFEVGRIYRIDDFKLKRKGEFVRCDRHWAALACDVVLIWVEGGSAWADVTLFRPVQPRKTDISIFTEMLHRAPERAGA